MCLCVRLVSEWQIEYGSICKGQECSIDINLPSPFNVRLLSFDTFRADFYMLSYFQGNVFFYYGLENYFQNHRRYVKSRSDKQLLGNLEVCATTQQKFP